MKIGNGLYLTARQLSVRFCVPLATLYQSIGTARFPLSPDVSNPRRWLLKNIEEWEETDPYLLRRGKTVDGQRQCVKCATWKSLVDYEDDRRIDGYSKTCVGCRLLPKVNYEKKNKTKQKRTRSKGDRRRYRTPQGRARSMCNGVRNRASLTPDVELLIYEKVKGNECELSGLPFQIESDSGKRRAFSPSVDRISNDEGYTKENTQVICLMANIGKNEWSQVDFIAMCVAVAERHADDPRITARLKELRGE